MEIPKRAQFLFAFSFICLWIEARLLLKKLLLKIKSKSTILFLASNVLKI